LSRGAVAVLGGLAALLAFAGTAGAALLEPVTITATAPDPRVVAGSPFELEVAVEAEAGTLDIAAQPLRVRVKLAPQCGGSFIGTPGPAALEQTLPTPAAGAAYRQLVSGKVTVASPGEEVVCAFLEDAQERQFATDTEEEVTVLAPGAAAPGTPTQAAKSCTSATRQMKTSKRKLKRLEHRIHKLQKKLRKAHGRHRRALTHKLHKLRVHKRKAAKRRRAASHKVTRVCS
jgi:hypothetical protein